MSKIAEIFSRFKQQFPAPKCELNYTNDYTLLVAIVLSAQTTDASVNKATAELFKIADTPEKMIQVGVERLKTYIHQIGLYNNKAVHIIALSEKLISEFKGIIPRDFDVLQTLPGVGRKTANVFLNTYYHEPRIGVDTHVFRLANKIGLCNGKNPLEVEKKLMVLVKKELSEEDACSVGHWLVLHGRYVCKAQKPLCDTCLIADLCAGKKNGK